MKHSRKKKHRHVYFILNKILENTLPKHREYPLLKTKMGPLRTRKNDF